MIISTGVGACLLLKCEQKQDAKHHAIWSINSSKRKQNKSKTNTISLSNSDQDKEKVQSAGKKAFLEIDAKSN